MKTKLKSIYRGILMIFYFFLYLLFLPLKFLKRFRNIWLICERGYDARDNGYHFYKFLKIEHPEINCYYVIDKKSSDYTNISNFGNILQPNTFKNILYFAVAKYRISSTVNGFAPNYYFALLLKKHHFSGKNIGLKHGIFKNNHVNYYKENAHLDLLCCGAKKEYDFVISNFHYRPDEIVYTGLARFDNLHNFEIKNQILIMPTFRIPYTSLSFDKFLETDYYKKWSQFLIELDSIQPNNISRIFYIHAMFQKFVPLFEKLHLKNIIIARFDNYDVQKLLKESKLLITDFSSVYFDFAYMRKPVIYYQFDFDFFNENHYEKGYFDYNNDGFGPIFDNSEFIMKEIKYLIQNDFKMREKYYMRAKSFFPLYDNRNCERIFDSIIKL